MDKGLIYIAGDPDQYPLEYYDPESGNFQGLIPELLRRFSQESGYTVQYYQPDSGDLRDSLTQQQQVDLVSAQTGESFSHTAGAPLTILEAETSSGRVAYSLFITDVAPSQLRGELSAFFSALSPAEQTGLLLESANAPPAHSTPPLAIAAAGAILTLAALAAALGLAVRRLRKRLRQYERERDTDPETQLGNLSWLRSRFSSDISARDRRSYCLCYLQIDLERLSGRETARTILDGAAEILRDSLDSTDLLARVADDGFALLRSSHQGDAPEAWVRSVLRRIRALPAAQAEHLLTGAGICPLQGEDWDLDGLLFRGKLCARAACAAGADHQSCSPEQGRQLQDQRRFRSEVKQGLADGAFQLYVQSYVNAATFAVVGAEALTRWNHPERGFLTPDRFIPLMEQEGLIVRLDQEMLERSCVFLEELWQQGVEDFFLSCNFSRASFSTPGFAEYCGCVLDKYHFPRELLIFEMTESVLPREQQHVLDNVSQLKALGIRLALDDFGVGFTSFYDLQEYAVDAIKLDKELIDNLRTQKGAAIVEAMIRVGHTLGLTVLAEGVADDEQIRILQNMGCDVFQGFRFAYPVPAWDAQAHILRDRKHQASGAGV